jgi:hypothetical protein
VGVTTVVGGGVVVVGLEELDAVEREVFDTTCERRVLSVFTTCVTRRGTVVVVVATVVVVVVVVATVVVVPDPNLAVGETMFAIAGSAVVLRTIPRTSEPIEPMSTERRGPRRDVEERPLGSLERFCPCVILVMDQLSKTNSKVLPTTAQHLVNLESGVAVEGDRGISGRRMNHVPRRHWPKYQLDQRQPLLRRRRRVTPLSACHRRQAKNVRRPGSTVSL